MGTGKVFTLNSKSNPSTLCPRQSVRPRSWSQNGPEKDCQRALATDSTRKNYAEGLTRNANCTESLNGTERTEHGLASTRGVQITHQKMQLRLGNHSIPCSKTTLPQTCTKRKNVLNKVYSVCCVNLGEDSPKAGAKGPATNDGEFENFWFWYERSRVTEAGCCHASFVVLTN